MIERMSNPTEQSRNLAQAGMPPDQAEAVAKAIHDLVDPLARKVEAGAPLHPEALKELRGDMGKLGDRLQDSIDKQGERLQDSIDKQGDRLQGNIDKQGDRIDKLAENMAEANKELQGNINRQGERIDKLAENMAEANKELQGNINRQGERIDKLAESMGEANKELQENINKQGDRLQDNIAKLAESMSKANKELQGNIGRLVESTHKAHIEQIAATNDSHSKIVNKISDLGADLAETKGVFRGAKWVMVGILVAVASAAIKYLFSPAG